MSSLNTSFFFRLLTSSVPYLFTIAIVSSVSYYAFSDYKKSSTDVTERLRQFENFHEDEIKKIKAAQDEERRASEESFRKLQIDLEDAKKKYEEDLKRLEEKRSREILSLLGKYGKDTSGMTEQVSRATGFPVYAPGLKQ